MVTPSRRNRCFFLINNRIVIEVDKAKPDLIWVDQGPFLGKELLMRFKKYRVPIVNYTIDDPFNGRDYLRFKQYFRALPYYDVLAVVRNENVGEAQKYGARHVIRVFRSADELAHRRREITEAQSNDYSRDVVFIGTWMPERGPFLSRLIELGVPVSIWGDRWQKAKEWPRLESRWRGPGIYDDDGYAACVISARVCIGLLSKGNRDLHTTRSLEIPSLGGLLCAQRTYEHLSLYRDGEEAIFWDTPEDCASACKILLTDKLMRNKIANAGHQRALSNNHYNEPTIRYIIEQAFEWKG